jgi:nucleoside-diphosphate-sugar epimerase
MSAIAVTGATGMLGTHFLWHALQIYPSVIALYRDDEKRAHVGSIFRLYDSEGAQAAFDRIEWRKADLLDPLELEAALVDVDTVFHLAAIVSFEGNNPNKLINENSGMASTVVNACLHLGIKHLVHLSSVAALGRKEDKTSNIGIDEDTHWENSKLNSTYAISKYRAEMEAWRGMVEGLNVLVINPPIILAPGFWNQSSGVLLPTVARGLPFYTKGENGFVDVRDLCRAMLLLVQNNHWNERFIVSGAHASYQEVFNHLAEAVDVRKPYIHLTPILGNILWRLEWLRSNLFGKKPLITKETHLSSQNKFRYLSEKVVQTINIKFTPLAETASWMAKWYQKSTLSKGFDQ